MGNCEYLCRHLRFDADQSWVMIHFFTKRYIAEARPASTSGADLKSIKYSIIFMHRGTLVTP